MCNYISRWLYITSNEVTWIVQSAISSDCAAVMEDCGYGAGLFSIHHIRSLSLRRWGAMLSNLPWDDAAHGRPLCDSWGSLVVFHQLDGRTKCWEQSGCTEMMERPWYKGRTLLWWAPSKLPLMMQPMDGGYGLERPMTIIRLKNLVQSHVNEDSSPENGKFSNFIIDSVF